MRQRNRPSRAAGRDLGWRGLAVIVALLLAVLPLRAEEDEDRYVVVKTKKTITISGEEIDDAMIVVKGGRVEAVGKKVDYPSDSRVIDASKLVAMPGLINPHTKIGLPAITRSGNKSNRKLGDLFYPPPDDTYEKLLASGYILLGLYPQGSGIPGQGLVQQTYEPKDKSGVKSEGLIRITLIRPSRDKKVLRKALKQAREAIKKKKEPTTQPAAATKPTTSRATGEQRPTTEPASGPATRPTTTPATQPATQPAAAKIPPEIAPLISLLEKKEGFLALVELSRASDLIHFADVIDEEEFARAYLFVGRSAADVHHVVDHALLGGADAVVALPPMLPNMPLTANPYNPVKLFTDAGCETALFPANDTVEGHRKVRERLALLVRAGLSREAALKGVTLHAARFLTVEKDYGSVEKGKRADLIFLDADPLDPFARVKRVMINGEMVLDLDRPRR